MPLSCAPRPELKIPADALYARFLLECENRAGKVEVAKLYSEMSEVALAAAYAPPSGTFTADLSVPGDHVFVVAGSGITPALSLAGTHR